jgi:hypothetical protein
MWGGEVNANLNVKGGTDTLRSSFNDAAFKSIQSQVDDTKRKVEQKTYTSEDEFTTSAKILKKEIFEETNTSDHVRVYEFYEQLQPYFTLLVLRHVRVGYSDGTDRPRVVELQDLGRLLSDVLIAADQEAQLTTYLGGELRDVSDQEGNHRSVLVPGDSSSDLVLDRKLRSSYQIQTDNDTVQTISIPGVITADKSWVEPTYTITCLQV